MRLLRAADCMIADCMIADCMRADCMRADCMRADCMQLFLLMAAALGPYSFVPFGALLLAGFAFAARNVPETRGKTLEQIEALMRNS